jgi:hypothetical protein
LTRFDPVFSVSVGDRAVWRRPRRRFGRRLHPRYSFQHLICQSNSTSKCNAIVLFIRLLVC